jgi:hypothetical protein
MEGSSPWEAPPLGSVQDSRNGSYPKTIASKIGELQIPRIGTQRLTRCRQGIDVFQGGVLLISTLYPGLGRNFT